LDLVLWWERSALIISGCSLISFPFTLIGNNRYGIQIWLTLNFRQPMARALHRRHWLASLTPRMVTDHWKVFIV
jgi:hypothetical protein